MSETIQTKLDGRRDHGNRQSTLVAARARVTVLGMVMAPGVALAAARASAAS